MKSRFFLTLAAFLIFSSSAFAVDFGVRYGQISDADEDFVGAELVFPIGAWSFNPSFEYWLVDDDELLGDVSIWTLNGDFNYNFNRGGAVNPYLGLGAAYSQFDSDFGDDDEIFANANAGLEFQFLETLKPYIQARYFRAFDSDDDGEESDDIAFMIGLRF